jgi:hypothetical protein
MKSRILGFIVLGLVVGMFFGCATVGVVSKPWEEVTVSEKKDMSWEQWEWLNFILGLSFLKGW